MPDEDQSGLHVWLILSKAYRSVAVNARKHIESLDLCLSDFAVLEVLLHKGPLPVNTIGAKVVLTSGSVTTAIDRLEAKGLVTRANDPGDRRTRIVHLTRAGRKLIQGAFAAHRDVMEEAFAPLSPAERSTLVRLLKKAGIHAARLAG